MSMISLRLRRALSFSPSILNHHKPPSSSIPAIHAPPQLSLSSSSSSQKPNELDLLNLPFQSRAFRSSNISLSSRPRTSSYNNDDSKISPDEILFEGCDYNHWLIVMNFPKDPKPSPEEMVDTYVQTAAKVLGSVEEAKKKIYACNTTTYTGFQVEVSEETSEKFNGLPGVIFVLPDSYIDPVNKEYGGDKYINGTIIPRPPPMQSPRYIGRHNDRNRDFNRPRGSYQQGSSTFDNQGPKQGDARNFRAPQNPSLQQNYSPSRVGERRDAMQMNSSPGEWNNQQGDRRDPMPSYQGNYNQGQRGNSYLQGQRDFTPGAQKNYAPPEQGDFRVDNRNYAHTQVGSLGPGSGGNYGQRTGGNYGQRAIGDYGQGAGGNYGQVAVGNHGQGAVGNYGQGAGGNYGQGVGGDNSVKEMSPNYRPSYSGQAGNQNFSQGLQMNNMQQGQQRNCEATVESGTAHGRY